jgi:hypothetical protein
VNNPSTLPFALLMTHSFIPSCIQAKMQIKQMRDVGERTSKTIHPFHYLRINFLSLLAGWVVVHSFLDMHALFLIESTTDVVKANFSSIKGEGQPWWW